jgi:hypothetical protein
MKVLICSLSNRPEFSDVNYKVLTKYCNRHNYKLVLENKILDETRAPAWSKILLLMREIKNNPDYDLIIWIDDDILITREDIKIEDLIKDYEFNNILISEEVRGPFNTGFLICKNNNTVYNYLQHIYDLCEDYPRFKNGGNWEQEIMHIHYYDNKEFYKIIPHNIIQSFYRDYDLPENKKWKLGHFSAHITGMNINKRIKLRDEILSYFSI